MRRRLTKLLMILLSVGLFFPCFIFAETIVLKSGKKVEGKLIEKTDKYIKIDFYGVPLTYFLDDVKSIEEESIENTSKAEAIYIEGRRLKEEAYLELYKKHNYSLAIEKYNKALENFKSIEQKYPHWDSTPSIKSLREECTEGINAANILQKVDLAHSDSLKGEYEDALSLFNQIILETKDKMPRYAAMAEAYIGSVYHQMGRYEDALNAYNRVLIDYKNEPYYCGMALAGIGGVYITMGKTKEAQEIYQKVLTEYKNYPPYAKMLKFLLELMPVESWQEMQGVYSMEVISKVQKFWMNQLSAEELKIFLDKQGRGDAFLLCMGIKNHIDGNLNDAKKNYQEFIDSSSNKEDFAYNLAVKALTKLINQASNK